MEFFNLIKATQKSGKPDAIHWQTAKTEARANLMLDVALEDAGIETGRGHDYNKPVRTDFPVFNDLPEEGTVDFDWCKRYELAEDGRTWQLIQTAAVDDEEAEDLSDAIESYKMGLSVELAHFWIGGMFTATPEERAAAIKAQMDMDNNYLQNVILAVNSIEPLKQCHNHIRHTLLEAIKSIWPLDGKTPELSHVLAFSKEWIEALNDNSAGRGNHRADVIEKWKAKSAPKPAAVHSVKGEPENMIRTDAGTNAGGQIKTDRNTDLAPSPDVLDIEIAAATLPMDFNIYEFPAGVVRRAKEIITNKEEPWKTWSAVLRKSPGILDFSRGAIFVLIRNAPTEVLHSIPALTSHVAKNLLEIKFMPDDGRPNSEERWNAIQHYFISPAAVEENGENADQQYAESKQPPAQLVKVGAGIFDATALFNAPSKDTAAENTNNVPVEEANNNETKTDSEIQPGEKAIHSTESHVAVNQETNALNNDTVHRNESTETQLFTHLMVDLECFGSNPDAPIVSIGAVFFNPETGGMGSEFYKVISLGSSMGFGGQPDADTILWWLKQSAEARSAILVDDAIPLDDALLQLNEFICENAANGPASVQLWGNGATYDNVLLRSSYRRTGIPALWEFWNDRDVRTIVELGKAIGINPRYEIPFEGDQHNALSDARHQVKYVSAIWQQLIKN
jgi:exodeoxyribonuclease VIII